MSQYRKLDDTITMRLNRTNAQFRDLDRIGSAGRGSVQDQACAHLWKELVGEHLCSTTFTDRTSLTEQHRKLEAQN